MIGNHRRGQGTIVGGAFVLLIIITTYGYLVTQQRAQMGYEEIVTQTHEKDLEKNQEKLEFIYLGPDDPTQDLFIKNTGPNLVHIVYIGDLNETTYIDVENDDVYLDVSRSVKLEDMLNSLGITTIDTEDRVQLVTEKGNTFVTDYVPTRDNPTHIDFDMEALLDQLLGAGRGGISEWDPDNNTITFTHANGIWEDIAPSCEIGNIILSNGVLVTTYEWKGQAHAQYEMVDRMYLDFILYNDYSVYRIEIRIQDSNRDGTILNEGTQSLDEKRFVRIWEGANEYKLDLYQNYTHNLFNGGEIDILNDAYYYNGDTSILESLKLNDATLIVGTMEGRVDIEINEICNNPPTVVWINPNNGDTVSGSVTIQIDAYDIEDVVGTLTVEWRVDSGTWEPTTYMGTYYEATWDTTTVSDSSHTLEARATDSQSATDTDSISVTVDNGAGTPIDEYLYVDGLSGSPSWSITGSSPYLNAQDEPTNYISTSSNGATSQWYTFESTSGSGSGFTVNMSIYWRCTSGDSYPEWELDWTGDGNPDVSGSFSTQGSYSWVNTGTIPDLDTATEINACRIRFRHNKGGAGPDQVNIDSARLGIKK